MARLFEKRMQACEQIALYKKQSGLSVRDSEREEQVVANNAKLIESPALVPYYKDFIRATMDVSCKYQSSLMRKMRVAYCGTEGAFAHIAAKRCIPIPNTLRFLTFKTHTRRPKAAIAIARCFLSKTVMRAKWARLWI